MFDCFTALADDQTDLVARNDNFAEPSTSVLAPHARGSTGRTVTLVSDDVINRGLRVSENRCETRIFQQFIQIRKISYNYLRDTYT